MNDRVPPADYILSVEDASTVLRHGGVIAMPTDTVYGIAASLDHPDAIERIFAIKGRETTKAIPLLVSDSELLARLSHHVDPWVATLTAQFWPGALTVVVNATDRVPDVVRRGLDTVGVRMPDDELALAIIQAAGGVLAVTSANPSGEPEARSAMEVWERLGGLIDGVVDGGQSPEAKPSTVVDVSGSAIRVLRDGVISGERIMAALGAGDPSGR